MKNSAKNIIVFVLVLCLVGASHKAFSQVGPVLNWEFVESEWDTFTIDGITSGESIKVVDYYPLIGGHYQNVISTSYFRGQVNTWANLTGFKSFSSVRNGCLIREHSLDSGTDWVKAIYGSGEIFNLSMDVDTGGNIFITGGFIGEIDFDTNPNITENRTSINNHTMSTFVVRLNPWGNLSWIKIFENMHSEIKPNTIKVDQDNNVIIGGEFTNPIDFDPNTGIEIRNSNTPLVPDMYVLKLDNNGNLIWVNTFEGTGRESIFDLNIDNSNNIYIRGMFNDTLDFDANIGIYSLTSPTGFYSDFICKLDKNGVHKWTNTQLTLTSNLFKGKVVVDSLGNVYELASFKGQVDVDPISGTLINSSGNYDVFIEKFDSLGNFIWVKTLQGTGDIYGTSINLNSQNDLIITGVFKDSIDLNPNLEIDQHVSSSDESSFIVKLDTSGNFIWGTSLISTDKINIKSVDLFGENSIYITGSLMGECDLNTSTFNHNVSSVQGSVFVAKYEDSEYFIGLSESNILDESIIVYPNPAKNWVGIELSNPVDQVSITITDMSGKVVLETITSQASYFLDTQLINKGVYFVRVIDLKEEKVIGMEKIIIQG